MVRSNRRAKGQNAYGRAEPSRAERDKVLIVTEGSKSEPEYFKRLISELRLTTAKVQIVGDGGSHPTNIVRDAKDILRRDDDFEQIYLVFDRDGVGRRLNYDTALSQVVDMQAVPNLKNKTIVAITSVPCFEIWYLFHVSEKVKPYEDAAGGGTPQKAVVSELKKTKLGKQCVFAHYEKSGCAGFFNSIASHRDEAVKRAGAVLKQAKKRGDPAHHENSSTRVHIVVEALTKLSQN